MVAISLLLEIEDEYQLVQLLRGLQVENLRRGAASVFQFKDLKAGEYRAGTQISKKRRQKRSGLSARRPNKKLITSPSDLRGFLSTNASLYCFLCRCARRAC